MNIFRNSANLFLQLVSSFLFFCTKPVSLNDRAINFCLFCLTRFSFFNDSTSIILWVQASPNINKINRNLIFYPYLKYFLKAMSNGFQRKLNTQKKKSKREKLFIFLSLIPTSIFASKCLNAPRFWEQKINQYFAWGNFFYWHFCI